MYDGTIVVLYRKPGKNGDAYYTRKANYGLNVQELKIETAKGVYGSGFDDVAQKKICVECVCHKMVTAWTLKSMLCKLMAMRAVSCVCELRPALNVPNI